MCESIRRRASSRASIALGKTDAAKPYSAATPSITGFSGQQPARHPARLAHQRAEPFSEEHGRWGHGSVGL